jgi:hypothetical protein
MLTRTLTRLGPVRAALYVDAGFELAVAVLLVVLAPVWADLFNVDQAVIWVAAAVFLLAAVGVGLIAAMEFESRELVYALAAANIAGGLVLWLMFALMRDDFDPGAQWAVAAVADAFILIGLLEILALRRAPPSVP